MEVSSMESWELSSFFSSHFDENLSGIIQTQKVLFSFMLHIVTFAAFSVSFLDIW